MEDTLEAVDILPVVVDILPEAAAILPEVAAEDIHPVEHAAMGVAAAENMVAEIEAVEVAGMAAEIEAVEVEVMAAAVTEAMAEVVEEAEGMGEVGEEVVEAEGATEMDMVEVVAAEGMAAVMAAMEVAASLTIPARIWKMLIGPPTHSQN